MAERMSNVKGLMQNGRARAIVFLVVAVIVFAVSWGFLHTRNKAPSDIQGGASLSHAPSMQVTPGISTNDQYNAVVNQANEAGARQAQEKGKPFVPILPSANTGPVNDPFPSIAAPKPPPVFPISPPADNNPTPRPVSPAPAPRQLTTTEVAQIKGSRDNAEKQVLGYLALWKPAAGTQEFNYTGVKPKDDSPGAVSGDRVSAASGAPRTSPQGSGAGVVLVRAGTVVPAVLITPINSDAPGPVLADVTSGPLAGARLIGSYQATSNQLVVQFKTLSMPGQQKSFRIDAYAVDSELRAGLATDVNNHYFKRYALAAASAFLQGYGEAIQRQNSVVTVNPLGGVSTQYGQLSASQINKSALAKVGEALSQEVQRNTNVRPTIKAEGQNGGPLPIGLLFLSDF